MENRKALAEFLNNSLQHDATWLAWEKGGTMVIYDLPRTIEKVIDVVFRELSKVYGEEQQA